jgi:mannose-6-phosphate isomerase-like protein (cupin superfamily)
VWNHARCLDVGHTLGRTCRTMGIKGQVYEKAVHNPEWLNSRAGERICIRVSGSQTASAYSVTEIVSSPGDGTRVHIHHNEDEHFFILEGTVHFLYGEKEFDAAPGTFLSLCRGIAHAWVNCTEAPIRMLVLFTPGGCEEALREIAQGADSTGISVISERYGISVVGPPLVSGR